VIDNFPAFSKLVAWDFQVIAKSAHVFVVDIEGDALYAAYLAAFPEGTNPLFKERTEHDCSCCKQFIRRAGAVVAVVADGQIHTVWDKAAMEAPAPYAEVARTLRDLVREAKISDIFRTSEKEISFGATQTRAMDKASGKVRTWDHFHTGTIPTNLRSATPDSVRGDYRTTVQVFERGLAELNSEAIDTVLSLIDANNLYRGAEHRHAVGEFQTSQRAYATKTPAARALFAWTHAQSPASRFRNTVIGTLVQDLSEGMDVDRAVGAFESKVAPQNYKRTSAVITPAMVNKAMEKIRELGLEPALERRFARIEDISVRDVLWVDNRVKPLMKGGIGDKLMEHAASSNGARSEEDEKRAEDIALETFMKDVLPSAGSLEVLFKGEHVSNLMSLTAPVHPEPKRLFRWDNDFAWSYGGNVTDSIKERVKKAGGNVTNAKLRISLSWFNFDDLDLHVVEPGGFHIYFRDKCGHYGSLDVDMNAGSGATRSPVENVSCVKVGDGVYSVYVQNYAKRETSDAGFVVEVENRGKLSHFTYAKPVRDRSDVHVVKIHLKDGVITRFEPVDDGVTTATISQDKWGLHTENYVKVNAVTLSPNYWGDNAVGNKHVFFVLDGAKNDEPTRGLYNEFLSPVLEGHRKVFEVIGDKTKCQPTEGQLSGLGFSSTKKDAVLVKVSQGKKQRLYNVRIGA
jgi:hypothetical protein